MRYRVLLGVASIALGLTYALAFGQNRPGTAGTQESQAIRQAMAAYAVAFNKGDVDGILGIWADDAEFTDEAGMTTKGRTALAALFRKSLQENKGLKVTITTNTLSFLKDDIAVQDGTAVLTHTGGETETSPFTAIWMKKDGKWLLQRVREFPAPTGAAAEGALAQLKDLGWLVGDWVHDANGTKTSITGRWMKGQKFLALEYTVHTKGDEVLALTQIVGWDPTNSQIHSWVFDSRGGFGEGAWSRKDRTWTVSVAGVTHDGRNGSGTNMWTGVDENTFIYQSTDREIDGQPLPDVKITYQRIKKSK